MNWPNILPDASVSFRYPLLLYTPLLLLILALWFRRQQQAALFPQLQFLRQAGVSMSVLARQIVLPILGWSFLCFLSIAAARPQRVQYLPVAFHSANIFLAIDISPSMGTDDFISGSSAVTRLRAVKKVIAEFVEGRPMDRIGLAVFGGKAFLQSPLTLDHDMILSLVDRLEVGMAGDGTALGDGLGVSLKHMRRIPAEAQAIVLLTDGVSNAGQVNPIKAAKVARDLGVKIHTIGIGSDQVRDTGIAGGIFPFSIRSQAEYDEETLRKIAELTGGAFFNARDMKGLQRVYKEINALQKTSQDEPERRIAEELFPQYALIAFLAYALYLLLTNTIWMKVP